MFHFQVAVHAVPYGTCARARHWQCLIAIALIVNNLVVRRLHLG